MIFVTRQTILTRLAGGVTRLAEFLFHRSEIRCKTLRIALLVALQILAAFFKAVACQTAAIVHRAKMRFMDESREVGLFALDRKWCEIDEPAFVLDVINAVTLRA